MDEVEVGDVLEEAVAGDAKECVEHALVIDAARADAIHHAAPKVTGALVEARHGLHGTVSP